MTVYAHGLVYSSVCATTEEEASSELNLQWPTGLDHSWSVANEPFRTGEANPHQCEQDPSKKHWLFTC